MCNAPKFGDVEERTGYGGGYNDRGVVEYKERKDDDDDDFDEFGRRRKKRRVESRSDDDSKDSSKYSSPPRSRSRKDEPEKEKEKEEEEEHEETEREVIYKNLFLLISYEFNMSFFLYNREKMRRTKMKTKMAIYQSMI